MTAKSGSAYPTRVSLQPAAPTHAANEKSDESKLERRVTRDMPLQQKQKLLGAEAFSAGVAGGPIAHHVVLNDLIEARLVS